VAQAEMMGEWLRNETGLLLPFAKHFVSSCVRARETAAHLHLPGPEWLQDIDFDERGWNDFGTIPDSELPNAVLKHMALMARDPLRINTPGGGESMANARQRVRSIMRTFQRRCNEKDVFLVCHKELMWAFRLLLERMTPETYLKLLESDNPFDMTHNGQVLHYTRVNPNDPRDVRPYFMWMRSICTTDLTRSSNTWQMIRRPTWTSEELLAEVEKVPRLERDPA